MLRLPRACQCTSTSTSLPCRHARPTTRSYSRRTAPNAAPSTTAATRQETPPETRATCHDDTSYPPPYGYPHPDRGQRSWFEPLQRNRSGLWKEWFNYRPVALREAPLPPRSSRLSSEEDSTTLLNDYLTNRGPRTGLNQFSDEYGQLLELAENESMPFLKAMVLEDLELKGLSNKGRNRLGLERFEKRRVARPENHLDEGEEAKLSAKGLVEVVESRNVQRGEPERGQKKVQGMVREAGIDSRKESLSILQEVMSSSVSATSYTIPQLSSAWDTFYESADLEDSLQDYAITLSFLHHLVSSSPANESDPLALALRVFSSLVHVLPEALIASPPTLSAASSGSSLPSDISLRFVLLRTLAHAAIDQDLFMISAKSLESINDLHRQLGSEGYSTVDRTEDSKLLTQTVEGWSQELRTERVQSYKPTELDSTRDSLDRLSTLFGLLRESKKEEETLEGDIETMLDKFVEEAGERYRWDLVSTVFQSWNTTSGQGLRYELKTNHLKCARWLSGEAPFSTYAPQREKAARRSAKPELFSFFARVTHAQLRRQESLSREWTSGEKYEWIDLLTTSKGATRETRSLARRITSYWIHLDHPTTSQTPFVLRGRTLLNLIRSSLSPATAVAVSPHRRDFLRSLVDSSIQALIRPQSPFSSTSTVANSPPQLSHYDLTTFAQAYALLKDYESVGQVYRKMIELKFLPDRKDVELILGADLNDDASVEGLQHLNLVKKARRVGVVVSLRTIESLLKGVMEDEVARRRDGGLMQKSRLGREGEWKARIDRILEYAKDDLEFDRDQLRTLEDFVLGYLPLAEPSRLVRLSDERLLSLLSTREGRDGRDVISNKLGLGLLQKCFEARHYSLATRLHRLILEGHSNPSPQALTLTLDTLLEAYVASPRSSGKRRILESLEAVIDMTLSSTSFTDLVSGRGNLALISRALIKVGQVEAMDKFWEIIEEKSQPRNEIKVDEATKMIVVRWAVGKLGRQEVLERDGVLGNWARDLLTKKEVLTTSC